jgi:hypothetical protein
MRFAISGVSAETMPIAPTAAAAQASRDSGLRRTAPGYNSTIDTDLNAPPHRPHWIVWLLGVTAAALVPWTLWLTYSLPERHVTHHYAVAWVGFDIVLAGALAATTAAALSGSDLLIPLAAATATMLLCDAWFDVVTSWGTAEGGDAVLEALLAELPLGAVCGFVALRWR